MCLSINAFESNYRVCYLYVPLCQLLVRSFVPCGGVILLKALLTALCEAVPSVDLILNAKLSKTSGTEIGG